MPSENVPKQVYFWVDLLQNSPGYFASAALIHFHDSIFGEEALNKTELPALDALVHAGPSFPGLGGAMFKIVTMQSVAAVVIAAALAATAVLLTSVAPPANAMSQPGLSNEPLARVVQQALPLTAAACSARSWPNYDQSCLRRSTGEPRQVRLINLETHGLQARAN